MAHKILVKPRLFPAEVSFDMIINRIASMVFDSFADTDVVVAILNHNGSYVASRLDVFEKVFCDRGLLDGLCRRVDDGQEPLIAHIDGFLVAASSLSAGFNGIGYVVMLLPGSSQQSFEHIEIILEQFSLIAGLIEQNQQLRDYSESGKSDMDLVAVACVN